MAGYMNNNYGYPQMNMNNQMSMSTPYYGYPNSTQSTIERLERMQNQQQMNNYPQQQTQEQTTNVNWIPVANIQQAKEQIVQPNTTIWMRDSYLPIIYVKSVSPVGKIDFQPYQLVPLDENGNLPSGQQMPVQQEQMVDSQNYVHVDEFNKLTQVVNELNKKIQMYEQLLQGQQVQVTEATKTSGRRGGNTNESSK